MNCFVNLILLNLSKTIIMKDSIVMRLKRDFSDVAISNISHQGRGRLSVMKSAPSIKMSDLVPCPGKTRTATTSQNPVLFLHRVIVTSRKCLSLYKTSVADPGGAPPGPIFFAISYSFSANFVKLYVGVPRWRVGVPWKWSKNAQFIEQWKIKV